MLKHLKFKQSYRETDTTPKILTNAQRDRHNPKDTERQTQSQRYRETDTVSKIQRDRHSLKDTERQTQPQRYRETDTTPKILTNAQRDRHNPKIQRDRQKHRDTDAVRER